MDDEKKFIKIAIVISVIGVITTIIIFGINIYNFYSPIIGSNPGEYDLALMVFSLPFVVILQLIVAVGILAVFAIIIGIFWMYYKLKNIIENRKNKKNDFINK